VGHVEGPEARARLPAHGGLCGQRRQLHVLQREHVQVRRAHARHREERRRGSQHRRQAHTGLEARGESRVRPGALQVSALSLSHHHCRSAELRGLRRSNELGLEELFVLMPLMENRKMSRFSS